MDVIQSPSNVQSRVASFRRAGYTVGVVPTMGALHDGHLSLIAAAKKECDIVLTTIFVNPTQFAPGEDFDHYPRPLENDLTLCRQTGADLVFAPSVSDMYPSGSQTTVSVGKLTQILEGASRPNHFDGVTTIVAKLLNVTQPDTAYFGQKDYQQQLIIRQMVNDLNWPVRIVTCPIVREPNGLAMSSRNRYLTEEERQHALVLSATLEAAQRLADDGKSSPGDIRKMMQQRLESAAGVQPDYSVVVDTATLQPLDHRPEQAVAILAAQVGNTRLIDNRILTFADDR